MFGGWGGAEVLLWDWDLFVCFILRGPLKI